MIRNFAKELAELVAKRELYDLGTLVKLTVHLASEIENYSEFEAKVLIANEFRSIGDFGRAKEVYEGLLSENSDVGENRATLLNNFGALCQDMGDYARALELYEQSLYISRRVLGPEHPSVATTMNNLAAVYEALGDYARALELYEHSLYIVKRVFGNSHQDVARILNNRAGVLARMGRFVDAKKDYQTALGIMEISLGKGNTYTKMLRANLSAIESQVVNKVEQGLPPDARSSRR
jgi:tetratricopeptide (TPR) repeat protein